MEIPFLTGSDSLNIRQYTLLSCMNVNRLTRKDIHILGKQKIVIASVLTSDISSRKSDGLYIWDILVMVARSNLHGLSSCK